MASASLDISSPENPSPLPKRYEIRRLTQEHAQWASALHAYCLVFHSPLVPKLYPDNKGKRFNDVVRGLGYSDRHQIASGYSLGIFDREFRYQDETSRKAGGIFRWDGTDDTLDEKTALAALDFPLVSIAMAFDGFNGLDKNSVSHWNAILPVRAIVFSHFDKVDRRGDERKATAPGQVLLRGGTHTRIDYNGQGLMSALARFQMRAAQLQGFKRIDIECAHDAVAHVWTHPKQEGMRSEVISHFRTDEHEVEDENGVKTKPLQAAHVTINRICVTVNE